MSLHRSTLERVAFVTTLAFGAVYAAACTEETVEATSTSGSTTTSSSSQGGGQTTGGGQNQGGQNQGGQNQGGMGGMNGQGGMACMPVNAPSPFFDCGGTGSVGSGMPSMCFTCVEDSNGDSYENECTAMGCECKINGVTACMCDKGPSGSTCDTCCPSPWSESTQPTGSGGGGGNSGNTTAVTVVTATSTGSN